MIRAVLDTNTLISAIINASGSVSRLIYEYCKAKKFLLITSSELLLEVDEVLHREKVRQFHRLSDMELEGVLKDLTSLSLIVPGETKVEVVRDPDDNKVITAAVEGSVEYIVSRDKDLLDLKQYREIKIISPEDFIQFLRN